VSNVGSGSVEVDPPGGTYDVDTLVTLTATAEVGWAFSGWSGDLLGSANPATLLMDEDKVVTANFVLEEYTLAVSAAGSGTVVWEPLQVTYQYGDVVTLTATANTGWHFSGWSGDLAGSENPASLTMTGDMAVTAGFTRDEYTLTVSNVGSGTVMRDPEQATYWHNTIVELTAMPAPGWSFSGWSGALTGSENPASMTMDGDKSVIAIYTQDEYALTVNKAGSGTVTKDPDQLRYLYGDVVTLTVAPDTGWGFGGWTGDLQGSDSPAVLVMDGDKGVTANFVQRFILTVDLVGHSQVVLDPPGGVYDLGTVVNLIPTADEGWTFDGWSGLYAADLIDNGDGTWSITMDSHKYVTARFLFGVHLPLIARGWPPVPDVPILNPIPNEDGDGSYRVSWSMAEGADNYLLEESTDGAFSEAEVIYTGDSLTYDVIERGAARYYYRVLARNAFGDSAWSVVQSVDVQWESEPNDDALTQANGPVVSDLTYYGVFAVLEDIQDYFYFDLPTDSPVELWLTDIPAWQNYNLVLRNANLDAVGYSGRPGENDEHILTGTLPAGRYYIQVFRESGNGSTLPYHLRVVYE
jgi:hypothetical protein